MLDQPNYALADDNPAALERHLAIRTVDSALAALAPHFSARGLSLASEHDRAELAALLVDRLERYGIRWQRRAAA